MTYQIQWSALIGTHGLSVSSTENVEAGSAQEALNATRTALITKLSELGKFFITQINVRNLAGPITLTTNESYTWLNSLNAEGGLGNVPNRLHGDGTKCKGVKSMETRIRQNF